MLATLAAAAILSGVTTTHFLSPVQPAPPFQWPVETVLTATNGEGPPGCHRIGGRAWICRKAYESPTCLFAHGTVSGECDTYIPRAICKQQTDIPRVCFITSTSWGWKETWINTDWSERHVFVMTDGNAIPQELQPEMHCSDKPQTLQGVTIKGGCMALNGAGDVMVFDQ